MDPIIARHKLLLITIKDEFDTESIEYASFIEHFKGYVPRGQLAAKKDLLGIFDALASRGHLRPGKYDVLKKISEDSSNNNITKLIEKAEEDISLLRKSSDNNGQQGSSTGPPRSRPTGRDATNDLNQLAEDSNIDNDQASEEYDSLALPDFHVITDYLNALKNGKEEDTTIRLMIIGCFDQGKTTLARRLMSHDLDGVESTNGIDIYNVTCQQDENVWNSVTEEDSYGHSMKRLALISMTQTDDSEIENTDNELDDAISTPTPGFKPFLARYGSSSIPSGDFMKLPPRPNDDSLSLFQQFKQEINKSNTIVKTQNMSLWDFGGQFVFYATHQLFHSRNAVYLLVFDLHKDINSPVIDEDYPGGTHPVVKSMKDYIEFWVTSVHSYVGNKECTQPQIILVGTHKDELEDEEKAEDYFECIREMFDGRQIRHHIYPECFAIAGKDLTDGKVNRLRETIVDIGRKKKEMLPASWLLLEYVLRQRQNIIKFEEVMTLNEESGSPIGSKHEMKSFLKFHHARGTFIYFDEGELAEFVVLKPSFIVDAFKCILTSGKFCRKDTALRPLWQKLTTRAILDPGLLQSVWSNDGNKDFIQFKDVLLAILKRHKIISEALKFNDNTAELSSLGYYIVPSFLRKAKQDEIETFIGKRRTTTVSLVYIFDNEAVVTTVFQRITGAAVGSWSVLELNGSSLLFENAGVYRINQRHAGVITYAEDKLELLVAPMCIEENIQAEVADFFRRFVENVIQNEFVKLRSAEEIDQIPFKVSVRCQHSLHNCKGSKAFYDLENLKEQSEKRVCCPDNVAHESIDIDHILHEWYGQNIVVTYVPKRTLTRQEHAVLSTAIGSEWRILGSLLGVNEITLQQIELDHQTTSMRIYEMLGSWEKEKEEKATLDVFVKEINKLPPNTVRMDVIRNLINNIYK
ncbi:uncharacterized protein LOC132719068 isoform X2 [Ruditapes philippinarum]|uniref:uncharacterized protein LOC132719068 isoform X2 n=1 Tax=Ruditapes philippinarum TaxID=129788 RepID=UPI00295B6219|nr:uncharacterized protein LOC132719068 isoform X2 [Ruditapes philippinarum]